MQQQKVRCKNPNLRKNPGLKFYVPNPKGLPMQVKQEEEEEAPAKRRSKRLQKQQPIRVQSPGGAATISQNNVYSVLGNAFLADLPHYVPSALQNSKLVLISPADIEESYNRVDHPITNETVTKYKKLIDEPLLRDVWMRAMCVELGHLVQGYGSTKETTP